MKKYIVFLMIFLLIPSVVWATQEHSDPEGLYSHQIAHLFFMIAMIVLIVQIKRTSPLPVGWRYISISALLFLFWNIDVFTVHWVRETIGPELFTGSDRHWTQQMDISTLRAKLFYFGKILDHFLSVGAFIVFIMGIRSFVISPPSEEITQ